MIRHRSACLSMDNLNIFEGRHNDRNSELQNLFYSLELITWDHLQVASELSPEFGFFFFFPQSLGAEKDSLDIIQHEWALPKFEQRAETLLKNIVR